MVAWPLGTVASRETSAIILKDKNACFREILARFCYLMSWKRLTLCGKQKAIYDNLQVGKGGGIFHFPFSICHFSPLTLVDSRRG